MLSRPACAPPPTSRSAPLGCGTAVGHSDLLASLALNRTSLLALEHILHAEAAFLARACRLAHVRGTACYSTSPEAPEPAACLPTFLGIGFEKCGSTKLFDLLARHPAVLTSRDKEANGFSARPSGTEETPRMDSYLEEQYGAWRSRPGGLPIALGEYTPGYAEASGCALDGGRRAAPRLVVQLQVQLLLPPETRFIVAMREPVERALSAYHYHIHTIDCWRRGPFRCLPPGTSFTVAVCHAAALLGGEEFLSSTQARLLATRADENALAAAIDEEEAPWCLTHADVKRRAQPLRPAIFPHWDLLTPGLYYDNVAPWLGRFGAARFVWFDMGWLASSKAVAGFLACLGLPAHTYDDAELRKPSNTQTLATADTAGAHSSVSASARAQNVAAFRLLDAFYPRSNQLIYEMTGIGGDWPRTAPGSSAEPGASPAHLARLYRTACRRCELNETTSMTHRC